MKTALPLQREGPHRSAFQAWPHASPKSTPKSLCPGQQVQGSTPWIFQRPDFATLSKHKGKKKLFLVRSSTFLQKGQRKWHTNRYGKWHTQTQSYHRYTQDQSQPTPDDRQRVPHSTCIHTQLDHTLVNITKWYPHPTGPKECIVRKRKLTFMKIHLKHPEIYTKSLKYFINQNLRH